MIEMRVVSPGALSSIPSFSCENPKINLNMAREKGLHLFGHSGQIFWIEVAVNALRESWIGMPHMRHDSLDITTLFLY